jgi:hypothetical protein
MTARGEEIFISLSFLFISKSFTDFQPLRGAQKIRLEWSWPNFAAQWTHLRERLGRVSRISRWVLRCVSVLSLPVTAFADFLYLHAGHISWFTPGEGGRDIAGDDWWEVLPQLASGACRPAAAAAAQRLMNKDARRIACARRQLQLLQISVKISTPSWGADVLRYLHESFLLRYLLTFFQISYEQIAFISLNTFKHPERYRYLKTSKDT